MLVIAGAGHVGQALGRLAGELGFLVDVIDDRADYASRERFAGARRIIVERPIADEFTERFAKTMEQVRVGPGLEPDTELGPLINAGPRDKVSDLVTGAADEGAAVRTGGRAPERGGYFSLPTGLGDVPAEAGILREEIFGPVAPIVRFDDADEAVRLANDTEYGLVSYLYTGDLRRGLEVAEALESGMVGVNRGMVSDPAAPFGGVKQSGIGREGGHEGLLEFCESKYIAVEW